MALSASTILGPSKPQPAEKEKPIDRVQAAEITDASTGHRIDKFLQLVLFPLCLVTALVLLLRRGIFS